MRSGNEPRKGGRPALSSERKKSQTLTFRTRTDLRKSLEAAAERAGRSISEEVEYRLQRSFDREAIILEIYGEIHAKLFRSLQKLLLFASSAKHINDGQDLSDDFIIAALILLLVYSGKNVKNIVNDETRQYNAVIAAAAEIADVMEIESSLAKK